MPKKEKGNQGTEYTLNDDLKKDIEKYQKLKNKKSSLEAQVKELNAEIEPLEKSIYDRMEGIGIQNLTLKGHLYFLSSRIYFSVTDRNKCLKWLKTKHPEMITYNHQSLTSFLKSEFIEKQKKIPSFFEQVSKEKVGIRAAKEKK